MAISRGGSGFRPRPPQTAQPAQPARGTGPDPSRGFQTAPILESAPSYLSPAPGGYSAGPSLTSAPMVSDPAPAPEVAVPSEENYLAGDSSYQTQFAALKAALERYQADQQLETSKYNTDYTTSLRDLGYDEGTKQWNWTDQLTAAGRAYQSQLNDFASRGMLQSQGYADANSDLQRLMTDQYGQMATNKTNFMTGMERSLANYQGENTSSQQAARAEAIARRAAQYGL